MGNPNDLPLNLTQQRRQRLLNSTQSSSTPSSNLNDPEMPEVLKTLRILSSASSYRRQQQIQQQMLANQSQSQNLTPNNGHICPNCNVIRVNQQQQLGCRSREQILKDLVKLEQTLELKGQKLPDWVKEYKNGDSIKAAKLLHIDYETNMRQMQAHTSLNITLSKIGNTNSNNKRPVKVQVAPVSSTTLSTEEKPSSTTTSQSKKITPHKKRCLGLSKIGDNKNDSSDSED